MYRTTNIPWILTMVMIVCIAQSGPGSAQDGLARIPDAIVLGEKIYLAPIDSTLAKLKRRQLSCDEYAKCEAERRWRPLVSKVSYHVMTDWTKRNQVRPTREEIERHFNDEAKKYLQEFSADSTGSKRVAFAVSMAVGHAVDWATAKALHEKYGGSIAGSAFGGIISIEGRNALLKEYAAAGKIRFSDPEIEKDFWTGVDDLGVLDVTVSDPERIARRFATPPWIGWGARMAKKLKENPDLYQPPGE